MSASSLHRRMGATPLSRYIPGVTSEALRRHGFASYELIANWTAIAGPALSSYALPLRLTRPGGTKAAGDQVDFPHQAQGASLLLKVDPARSLEIQYLVPQLIERINACLGYRAVATIRIVQVPLGIAMPARKVCAPPAPRATTLAQDRPANRLARALDRLTHSRTAHTRRAAQQESHSRASVSSRKVAEL